MLGTRLRAYPFGFGQMLISREALVLGGAQAPCDATLVGQRVRFYVSDESHMQMATSHSTPEAEIVAADLALGTETIPAPSFGDHLLQRRI